MTPPTTQAQHPAHFHIRVKHYGAKGLNYLYEGMNGKYAMLRKGRRGRRMVIVGSRQQAERLLGGNGYGNCIWWLERVE